MKQVRIIKKDKIMDLKSNLDVQLASYMNANEEVCMLCKESDFLDTKYFYSDFDLDMSEINSRETDFENVKRLYNSLKFLSNSEASDERLWVSFALKDFWAYTQYRWPEKNSVQSRYFFESDSRRSLTRHAIARLWWIGRLTYDEKNADPYHLTQFVLSNSDYTSAILERNFSNNFVLLKSFVLSLVECQNEGYLVDRTVVRSLAKYANLLGGTYILDTLSEQDLIKKIKQRALIEIKRKMSMQV